MTPSRGTTALALVLGGISSACGGGDATEIVLVVHTDLSVPDELEQVTVAVTGPSGIPDTVSVGVAAGNVAFPLTLGLSPRGAPSSVSIVVTGFVGGVEQVKRRVDTAFVRGRRLLLEVVLETACRGVPCGGGESCLHGVCGSSQVDPSTLASFDGVIPDVVPDGCGTAVEVCDGRDNDCDSLIDENIDLNTDTLNCGACGQACTAGATCEDGLCSDVRVTDVAAGGFHTCVLRGAGTVSCWGDNESGTLGTGDVVSTSLPVDVVDLSNVVQVAAGGRYVCARQASGAVDCWGSNFFGQLGNGTTANTNRPGRVSGLDNAVDLETGTSHACAILDTGEATCWGRNDQGQVGVGVADMSRPTPNLVMNLGPVSAVSAGTVHTCAIEVDSGAVSCWGDNEFGELGNGTMVDSSVPVAVQGLPASAVSVTAGTDHTCAALDDQRVFCWGSNASGQLGDGTFAASPVPVEVMGLTDAQSLDSGEANGQTTCALRALGQLSCWGLNDEGQIGDGTQSNRQTPLAVGFPVDVEDVNVGAYHTCGLLADGRVLCWGWNMYGQLGLGTSGDIPQLLPIEVMDLY